MTTISRDTYPAPPSMEAEDGRPSATSGVIYSLGRGQVAQPQALIVEQATARKDAPN